MKKTLFILLLSVTLPAFSQNVGYSEHKGKVVDAETGKPVPYAKVFHSIGGTSDRDGNFTVRYYFEESSLQVYVSHPDYYPDTFGYAPALVRLRPLPKDSIERRNDNNFHKSQLEKM